MFSYGRRLRRTTVAFCLSIGKHIAFAYTLTTESAPRGKRRKMLMHWFSYDKNISPGPPGAQNFFGPTSPSQTHCVCLYIDHRIGASWEKAKKADALVFLRQKHLPRAPWDRKFRANISQPNTLRLPIL